MNVKWIVDTNYPPVTKHGNQKFTIMWVKQCHKPPMTGNGKFIPPIKMVMTGGLFFVLPIRPRRPRLDHTHAVPCIAALVWHRHITFAAAAGVGRRVVRPWEPLEL